MPMLSELDHAFKRTYVSKVAVKRFLSKLLKTEKLAGDDVCAFWCDIRFLSIQGGGNSQREMLEMFGEVLQEKCGIAIQDCGEASDTFLYLDDGLFSGNRVRNDIRTWVESEAPRKAKVHCVFIAVHLGGQHYASSSVKAAVSAAHKEIEFAWWRSLEFEDRKSEINTSEVLRPSWLPNEDLANTYVRMLKKAGFPPILRTRGKMGESKVFSSEKGRDLLEQQFLRAGLQIREMCPYLKENHRPLGYSVLQTLGFGSLLVTYRNCPNNCPLALWASDPWYPLFPRKTN
ncbi:MAG: hypothetical protein L0338_00710 [Acidobacteria bacterium]|nr:hypothetical protein [Acidobacteriota bacterium]